MTKNKENKLTMFKAVIETLIQNLSIISGYTVLMEAFEAFKSAIQKIENYDNEFKTVAAGKYEAKEEAEENLINNLIPLASGLYGYARKVKNNELKNICRLRPSYLERMRDTELLTKAKAIKNLLETHLVDLAGYLITQDKIDNYNGLIDVYESRLGDLETSLAEKKAAKDIMFDSFAEADDILKEDIDFLIETLKNDHPEFYLLYQNSRNIKDI